MGPSLSTNTDSSTANAKIIGGTRNSTERRRHLGKSDNVEDNQKWLMGNNQPMVFLISLPG